MGAHFCNSNFNLVIRTINLITLLFVFHAKRIDSIFKKISKQITTTTTTLESCAISSLFSIKDILVEVVTLSYRNNFVFQNSLPSVTLLKSSFHNTFFSFFLYNLERTFLCFLYNLQFMFVLLLTLLVSNSDCFAIALLCLRHVRKMVSPGYFLFNCFRNV